MKKAIVLILITLVVFTLAFFGNTKKEDSGSLIVFTQIPIDYEDLDNPFPDQARIVSISEDQLNPIVEVISKGFNSARSPHISYDGTKVLFSGQLNNDDTWQIWEMDIKSQKTRQITNQEADCTDPLYLANGEVLFSMATRDQSEFQGFALYRTFMDAEVERVTFHPHQDLLSNISQDGRIITNSRQVFPESSQPKLMAMRPDGTKTTLYYKSPDGYIPVSRGYEMENERFIFVEKNVMTKSTELVSISVNRPLNSRTIHTGLAGNQIHSIYPFEDRFLVSMKAASGNEFGLHILKKEDQEVQTLFQDPIFHSVEMVAVHKRNIPKNLPSRVDRNSDSGRILCMDANQSDLDIGVEQKTRHIKVSGIQGEIGRFPVEEDGSFYLEIKADTPVRFQALDLEGNEVLDPSSWLWVRPNENRGCVGCHADPELTPGNRVPDAINKEPILFIDGLAKEVDL